MGTRQFKLKKKACIRFSFREKYDCSFHVYSLQRLIPPLLKFIISFIVLQFEEDVVYCFANVGRSVVY